MSGEARSAASNRESPPEADEKMLQIATREHEAEGVSGEARSAASNRESPPEADNEMVQIANAGQRGRGSER